MKLLATLREWLDESDEPYKDAMALATATKDGAPSVRMVSLRGIEPSAIRFFTGLRSRKAGELERIHARPRSSSFDRAAGKFASKA